MALKFFFANHAPVKASAISFAVITILLACATFPSPKIKKRKLNGLIKKYKNVPVTSAPPTIA